MLVRALILVLVLAPSLPAAAGWIESPPLASVVQQAKRHMVLVRIGTKW